MWINRLDLLILSISLALPVLLTLLVCFTVYRSTICLNHTFYLMLIYYWLRGFVSGQTVPATLYTLLYTPPFLYCYPLSFKPCLPYGSLLSTDTTAIYTQSQKIPAIPAFPYPISYKSPQFHQISIKTHKPITIPFIYSFTVRRIIPLFALVCHCFYWI